MRPDIVVSNNDRNSTVVLDTKWKMLSPQYGNTYGISQADMYQMYIYHRKYHPNKVLLIYPFNGAIRNSSTSLPYVAIDDVEVRVEAMFFDLMNVPDSLKRIEESMAL